MKIVITGGAGFIGSHLAEHFLRQGEEVHIIDNLSDFYAREWKLRNLHEMRVTGHAVFHETDICEPAQLDCVMEASRPDVVVHLAADAGLRRSVLDPLRYMRTNVQGTTCVLESCRKYGISRVLFASSSSVYGASVNVPFHEEEQPLRPLSPYAATKLAGEQICYVYHRLHGMRVSCLRLFTVYGPRQRPDLAVRNFMERIAAGVPITMYGDGSSGRDYTYVGDIVDGIARALEHSHDYEIFNLGNSHPVRLVDMIGMLEQVMGTKAIIERQDWNDSEAPLTWASIDKASRLLGYEPKVGLEQGIIHAVNWWRKALGVVGAATAIPA